MRYLLGTGNTGEFTFRFLAASYLRHPARLSNIQIETNPDVAYSTLGFFRVYPC
jgi:hypothetical protein